MKTLKIDRTKLKTVNNYAKQIGVDRQRVYYLIRLGKLKTEIIDGVTFINVE
jgi:hypothetical protein